MNLFVRNIEFLAQFSKNAIISVYEVIYHQKASTEVIKFIENLFYIGTSSLVAAVLALIFNILSGRILGPAEYGKSVMIQTIGMFLQIPMLLGTSIAMLKFNSEKEDFKRQKTIISTSYALILIFTALSTLFFILFSQQIIRIFDTAEELYYLSIIFAILYVLQTATTHTLRSLHETKLFSKLTYLNSSVMLLSFLVFMFFNYISFKSVIFSTYISYIIVSAVTLIYIRQFITRNVDKNWMNKILRYSSLSVLSAISFMLYTNIGKVFINKYMSIEDVGLYNAYTFSSINQIVLFSEIFISVFFPTISKYSDKIVIMHKINKIIPLLIAISFPVILVIEYIILNFYGNKYSINILLMVMFAITSIMFLCYRIYIWIFNSEGEKGAKSTLISSISIAITNIILNIYLIPRFGLYGAIGATALGYGVGLYTIYNQKHVLKNTLA